MAEGLSRMQIGELAERVGVPTSTLRYYEREGLLEPSGRSEAGYRLYSEDDLERALLIRRAQRAGLALADIRALLHGDSEPSPEQTNGRRPMGQRPTGQRPSGRRSGARRVAEIAEIAEHRLFDIERRLTSLLVQRHELAALVQDLESGVLEEGGSDMSALFSRVCRSEAGAFMPWESFRELAQRLDCALQSETAGAVIEKLRGQHYHVWEDGDTYKVLAVDPSQTVREALSELAGLEESCTIHRSPSVRRHEQGMLLVAGGQSAFLYATLFLSLDNGRRREI